MESENGVVGPLLSSLPVTRLSGHQASVLSFIVLRDKNLLNLTVSHYLFLLYKPNTGDALGHYQVRRHLGVFFQPTL